MPETVKIPVSMPLSTDLPMKAEMPAIVRKRFIVKGRVQKVGYRDEVQEAARALGVTGFVRNLKSGDVEVACEGEEPALGKFEKALAMKKDLIEVREVVPAGTPPKKGRFAYFEIKYGPMQEELGEWMGLLCIKDVGQKVDRVGKDVQVVGQKIDSLGQKMDGLGEKVDGVGKAVEVVGQKVDGVGKDVKVVGQKVDSMHSDMNTRFDHMAQRYDLIATSLVKAIDRMDQGFERMDKDSKRTDRAIEQSRKEVAASNRELAGAVRFMITKLSKKAPAPRKARPKKRHN
jgi:acylphosphatase/archaellum component FlaC